MLRDGISWLGRHLTTTSSTGRDNLQLICILKAVMLRIQLCASNKQRHAKKLCCTAWCDVSILRYIYDIYILRYCWSWFGIEVSLCLYRRTDDMSVVTGKTVHALAQAHPNTSSTIILWGISMKLSAFQTLATPHHPTHSKSDRIAQNTITMAAHMPVISWSSFAQCLGRPSVFQAHRIHRPWWRKRRERRERKPRPKTPSRRLRQSWLQRHPPNCHPRHPPNWLQRIPRPRPKSGKQRRRKVQNPKRRRKLRTKKALRKRTVALVFATSLISKKYRMPARRLCSARTSPRFLAAQF